MDVKVDWGAVPPFWQGCSDERKGELRTTLAYATEKGLLAIDAHGDRWFRDGPADPWKVCPKGADLNLGGDALARLASYAPEVRRDVEALLGGSAARAYALHVVSSNGDEWRRASASDTWRVELRAAASP